jgi:hypothetical protein
MVEETERVGVSATVTHAFAHQAIVSLFIYGSSDSSHTSCYAFSALVPAEPTAGGLFEAPGEQAPRISASSISAKASLDYP